MTSHTQVAIGVLQVVGLFVPALIIAIRLIIEKTGGSPDEDTVGYTQRSRTALRDVIALVGILSLGGALAAGTLATVVASVMMQSSLILVGLGLLATPVILFKRVYRDFDYNFDVTRAP